MVGAGEYAESQVSAEELLPNLNLDFDAVHSLTGRASARVSGPDMQEQVTLNFTSDRTQSLLAMRNNLGIEGGRIYADADSVIMYDRIEKKAWKMSIMDSHKILLNGFSAFNVIDFLMPDLDPEDIEKVLESEDKWKLKLHSGATFFFTKNDGLLVRMTKPAVDPEAYNKFIFSNHAQISNHTLPRRIQILSNDEKSTIFLLIQALELNPSAPSFDIGIPDDIPVERI